MRETELTVQEQVRNKLAQYREAITAEHEYRQMAHAKAQEASQLASEIIQLAPNK